MSCRVGPPCKAVGVASGNASVSLVKLDVLWWWLLHPQKIAGTQQTLTWWRRLGQIIDQYCMTTGALAYLDRKVWIQDSVLTPCFMVSERTTVLSNHSHTHMGIASIDHDSDY